MTRSRQVGVKAVLHRPPTLEELFAKAGHHPSPPPDPKAGLWRLLERLEALRAAGVKVERHELADKIMDIFTSFPSDANGWLQEWRMDHPEARRA